LKTKKFPRAEYIEMAYNEHLCHGVPLEIDPLAQLLFAYTNTNKPKTPLVPLCHRLFFDRKKNLCPQYFTYGGTTPKNRI